MNKKILLTALLVLTITLSACAYNAATPTSTKNTSSLPKPTQLIIGTLMLEDTENAVTSEQASALLPMWYVMRDLSQSDTAAQEEIDGLTNQIQETMTNAQMAAIEKMALTREDMFTLMRGGNSTQKNASAAANNSTGSRSGDMGAPPEMGGMPGEMQTGSSRASNTSGTNSNQQMNSAPSALYDLVIELLQKKINQ